jgi:hypothetical protein
VQKVETADSVAEVGAAVQLTEPEQPLGLAESVVLV